MQENSSIQCLESKKKAKRIRQCKIHNTQNLKDTMVKGYKPSSAKILMRNFKKKANQANMSESAFLELIIEFNNSEQIDLFLELNKYKKINERLKNELVCLIENIQKIQKKNKRILNGKYY